ncbi:MAG: MFS transporter [Cyanobacteria bacterium REEB67]|nr:MFS transporter [Cyanobacteria bacterium REEB67]
MTAGAHQLPLSEKPTVPRHALIGILAVSLSAVISTLGSGLIGAGLEDLRGIWGIGIDDAAYVTTIFNASQMFIGPVSVMLAARFGHRQVLLYAGAIYVLASLLLPLMPPVVPIYVFLMMAGLSSGTFYPLCLSFITRNLPLALVTYGIAAYNLDLLATNHLLQSLEGYFMDHIGWRWIFWAPCMLTMPMLYCVYRGIPRTPQSQLLPHFRYAGLLYLAMALTLFYIALDQGERLDWYNNGLINGLFIAGVLLLVAAALSNKYFPNPFLDFSYLKKRNVLLVGFLMLAFRFGLIRVGFLIPAFLETMHQYRQPEIGRLFMLSVVPFLIALPTCALLMNRFRVRPMACIGLTILALINFHDAHALQTWELFEFVDSQMVGAIGICMLSMATIAGIVFTGRTSGAYKNRSGAYAQGAFFQIARLFASVASVSAFRRYLLLREHFWQTKLVADLQKNWAFDQRLADLGTALSSQAPGPQQALEIGRTLIAKTVQQQSLTLAFDDTFMLLAWVCVFGLIAVSMMTRIPLPKDLPEADKG